MDFVALAGVAFPVEGDLAGGLGGCHNGIYGQETETWQRTATYLSVIGYDSVHDRIVLHHDDGFYTAPLYSTEEKVKLGHERLS